MLSLPQSSLMLGQLPRQREPRRHCDSNPFTGGSAIDAIIKFSGPF